MSQELPTEESVSDWASAFELCPETTYLNHGSFSPALKCVRELRESWTDQLDRQPMNFYLRQLEPAWMAARQSLADFVGSRPEDLALVDNATYAMNVVAASVSLGPGDEVLVSDHEYGAVVRIWQRACQKVGALLKVAPLPKQIDDADEVVEALLAGVSPQTRLLVVSHITSATAIVLPVSKICEAFSGRGIPVCVDGPHAPAQVELSMQDLGCDYYTASCHKWLCGSLGTGFLYVHPRQREVVQPPVLGWGRLEPAVPSGWDQEFIWPGTRNPCSFLALPAAIDFLRRQVGLEKFRSRSSQLAGDAELRLTQQFGTSPIAARANGFYSAMCHVPLPAGDWSTLQAQLWHRFQIEVMVVWFQERWYLRASFHLYNDEQQTEMLCRSLRTLGVG